MKKDLLMRKILCSVLAAGIGGFVLPLAAQAASGGDGQQDGDYIGNEKSCYKVVVESDDRFADVYGKKTEENVDSASVTMKDGTVNNVYGGYTDHGNATNNIVDIKIDSNVNANVYGGWVSRVIGDNDITKIHNINKNSVTIDGSNIGGYVYGGYVNAIGNPNDKFSTNVEVQGNIVEIINNSTVDESVYGGRIVTDNTKSGDRNVKNNHVKIADSTIKESVYGGMMIHGYYGNIKENTVTISGSSIVEKDVYGGFIQEGGNWLTGPSEVTYNTVNISSTVVGNVYGGMIATGNLGDVGNNEVTISYGGAVKGDIYGGYAGDGSAENNSITLSGTADVSGADIYGSNLANTYTEGNALIIDGWQGKVNSVNNFNNINFQNLKWQNEGTVLEIINASGSNLAGTAINLTPISVAGGEEIIVGDYMYIIKGKDDAQLGTEQDKTTGRQRFSAGVAIDGTGEVIIEDNGNVKFEVTGTSVNDQTMLVAENRAVAAAFVNQGTDLISDSMDTLSRDGKYGVKTFAAVHGNRSKYDVNSDIKINGWSSIVGVGNEKALDNGDFSWGVFYENGSGNYRTYNEFNNEFFRGDGSLVYNGGGVAARYEQDNGVYTEGSLRAGMLKSEMSNALKDGAGNSYGYKSESSYYGAHLGVGKVITLDDNKDLDIYGKFFHTYTDGDSFTVAGDKFEFDSITSDRLRVGARLTTNKENKVSTYYGLAYEYEFNGDAQMRAQNMSAPEQSLQGSSYMAEVGMNYQTDEDSPWSFDLNMRGYAGEREGGSFSVQATYTF